MKPDPLDHPLCPICARPLIPGPSVNEHHFIPKSFKGGETQTLHVVCHSKIHSIWSERELLNEYNNPARVREHPEMQKFIRWIAKKHPEYRTRNVATQERRRRR